MFHLLTTLPLFCLKTTVNQAESLQNKLLMQMKPLALYVWLKLQETKALSHWLLNLSANQLNYFSAGITNRIIHLNR